MKQSRGRYLVDTHVLLWWLSDDPQLTPAIRQTINSGENEIVVSAATLWEIALKTALGKLKTPDDLLTILEENNFSLLPISARHAQAVGSLVPLHKDPFDRMLVIQAHMESLTIITHDKMIEAYAGHIIRPLMV